MKIEKKLPKRRGRQEQYPWAAWFKLLHDRKDPDCCLCLEHGTDFQATPLAFSRTVRSHLKKHKLKGYGVSVRENCVYITQTPVRQKRK